MVPPDIEAREGPIMPSEDWFEQDVLLSASGWIEVHVGRSGCIVSHFTSTPAHYYLESWTRGHSVHLLPVGIILSACDDGSHHLASSLGLPISAH